MRVRQVLTADNIETTAACLLENLYIQTGVQVISASRNTLEHGVIGTHEFHDDQIARDFRGHVDDLGQWNAFCDQHVMNHCEHQNAIEPSTRSVEE